ncbi:serine/threonine-protein kinase [Rhodococcus tibetensis]|uniref:Serine/threonine-protein kinase PknK n=1 Tax=Rhodococcus tibetensis TaxID=2965064 RepID=A0ABT1Q9K5_9NOCA|nr:serine/threonine-protein kinase [Rhodococcus sp. FXJ9.536]MCQ4118921.1 protein kinase [Rhodococcus sp. FXJ9.536]
MADVDPGATQRTPDIGAELSAAGFDEAVEIGRGGFGVVYRCSQHDLDRSVAVKVLATDVEQESLERFVREQRAMGRLSGHPNIVDLYQVGVIEAGHRPFLVMPFHAAGSLDTRIRRKGPVGWAEVLHIGIKLAGALETAHCAQILHRDVKPANVLLTVYQEPQLTDFGIARVSGGFETSSGVITGSPAFTAPEVLEGRAPSVTSDIYSLGALLFSCLTGHAAHERRSGEKVISQFVRITTEPIPDLRESGVPAEVCAAIERAMDRTVENRPRTAAEFGYELQQAQLRHGLIMDAMDLLGKHVLGPPIGPVPAGAERAALGSGDFSADRTPPAPMTKYRPPSTTRALIARNRLIEMLRAGDRRRLTVIHAPAGYGKSTLAAQWRDALTADGVVVAWLTVDGDDNNVLWLLSHVIESITRVRPELTTDLGQIVEEHGAAAAQSVLSILINTIHENGEDLALVVDDWHRVTDRTAVAALAFLLDHGCHHLRIIVTSRTQAGLPLGRMRVQDELVEISPAELCFDTPEAGAFLYGAGLRLEEEDVTNLRDTTDGWIAALQLASLSLRGSPDPTTLISHLSGRHRAIGEYLAENVLDTLEPVLLDFLLATSVTERICGSLASTLADIREGQAWLEEVEKRDLFLHRIDDEGQWFRYHHLFAEFLHRRIERDQPKRVDELHRRAFGWFRDHNLLSEAVDQALAAHDSAAAVDLLEQEGTYLVEQSQMSTQIGLITKLPRDPAESSIRLQLCVGWADTELQRIASARLALARARRLLAPSSHQDSRLSALRAEADVLESAIEVSVDKVTGIRKLIAECLAHPDNYSPFLISAAALCATYVETYAFDFAAARRWHAWAGPYHERTRGPYTVVYSYGYAAIASNEQLDTTTAQDTLETGLELARAAGGVNSQPARLLRGQLGELFYERGNIDEAERLLGETFDVGALGGAVDFFTCHYAIGARIKILRGDRHGASAHLDEGAAIAERLSLPRLRARIDNERIRWGLAMRPDFVPVNYEARQHPVDGIELITAQLDDDTAISSLLAQNTPEAVARACVWAQEWVQAVEGRARASLQARLLLVSCLYAAGRVDDAKTALRPAAAGCAAHGMVRYLIDSGPHVISTLDLLDEDGPDWAPGSGALVDGVRAARSTAPRWRC